MDRDSRTVHAVKRINFLGKITPIVLQNENGPCPLIAIANCLLLLRWIKLGNRFDYVANSWIVEQVGLFIKNGNKESETDPAVWRNMQVLIHDVIRLLPQLETGMDVNVRFGDCESFEFTPPLSVFDLTGLRLLHGFIIDRDAERSVHEVAAELSYNQALDYLVTADEKAMAAAAGASALATAASEGVGVAPRSTPSSARHMSAADAAAYSFSPEALELLGRARSNEGSGVRDLASAGLSSASSSAAGAGRVPLGRSASIGGFPGRQRATAAAAATDSTGDDADEDSTAQPGRAGGERFPEVAAGAASEVTAEISGPGGVKRVVLAAGASDVAAAADAGASPAGSSQPSAGAAAVPTRAADSAAHRVAGIADVGASTIVPASGGAATHVELPASAASGPAATTDTAAAAGVNDAAAPHVRTDSAVLNAASAGPASRERPAASPHNTAFASFGSAGRGTSAREPSSDASQAAAAQAAAEMEAATLMSNATMLRSWLDCNATQLTFAGLAQILARMTDMELAVLYRNNHFSTVFKHRGQLYQLLTDEGYLDLDICWEGLDDVTGNTQYYMDDFKPAGLSSGPSPARARDGSGAGGSGSRGAGSGASTSAPLPIPGRESTFSSAAAPTHEAGRSRANHGPAGGTGGAPPGGSHRTGSGVELPSDFDSLSAEERDMLAQVLAASKAEFESSTRGAPGAAGGHPSGGDWQHPGAAPAMNPLSASASGSSGAPSSASSVGAPPPGHYPPGSTVVVLGPDGRPITTFPAEPRGGSASATGVTYHLSTPGTAYPALPTTGPTLAAGASGFPVQSAAPSSSSSSAAPGPRPTPPGNTGGAVDSAAGGDGWFAGSSDLPFGVIGGASSNVDVGLPPPSGFLGLGGLGQALGLTGGGGGSAGSSAGAAQVHGSGSAVTSAAGSAVGSSGSSSLHVPQISTGPAASARPTGTGPYTSVAPAPAAAPGPRPSPRAVNPNDRYAAQAAQLAALAAVREGRATGTPTASAGRAASTGVGPAQVPAGRAPSGPAHAASGGSVGSGRPMTDEELAYRLQMEENGFVLDAATGRYVQPSAAAAAPAEAARHRQQQGGSAHRGPAPAAAPTGRGRRNSREGKSDDSGCVIS